MLKNILLDLLACLHQKIGIRLVAPFFILTLGNVFAQDPVPFTCEAGQSFVTTAINNLASSPTNLYSEDILSGIRTVIKAPLVVAASSNKVNAVGYNVLDNLLWGSAVGTNAIVRIDKNGDTKSFDVTGLPADTYTAGDVDQAGYLYLYKAGASTMYKVNLNVPGDVKTAIPITLSTGYALGDISVNADGSKIFGIANNGDLITYAVTGTTATGTATDVGIGAAAQSYNTFLDLRGNIYAQYNPQGETYMVDPNSANPVGQQVTRRDNATRSFNGDGARCPTSEVIAQTPIGCTNFAYSINDPLGGTCNDATNTNLFVTDLETETTTILGANLTNGAPDGHLNGLAFNPKDGYLWAFRIGSAQLVRIGSEGTVQYFPIEGLVGNNICGPRLFASDINDDGVMYGIGIEPGNLLYRIDLNPGSPTYLTLLGTQAMTNIPALQVADIAFNPKDNMLYGVSSGQHIFRIDPATGIGTDIGATGVAPGGAVVSNLFDASGDLYFQMTNSPNLYRVPDTDSGSSNATLVKNNLTPPENGDGASCRQARFFGVSISGYVWDDANGDLFKASGEANTVTDDPAQTLTVYLTDPDGFIIAKTPVALDGIWSIENTPAGTFNVALSNDPSLAVGNTTAIPATLPGSGLWVTTGINFPGSTGTQAGTNSGVIVVGTTLDVANINFGIEKIPSADDKAFLLKSTPMTSSSITLNGTWPVDVSPTQLTGNDYEDGPYDGAAAEGAATDIQIISLPIALDGPAFAGFPELFYNGMSVTVGLIIENYDQNLLIVKLNGKGYKGVSFTYQTIDAADRHSATATYVIQWPEPLPVKLVYFDGAKEENIARLNWVTSEESNADRFELERSADARNWKYIGVVSAAGESKSMMNYAFDDVTPVSGNNYYRLKMIDNDDTFAYSRILHLSFEDIEAAFAPYPNPVVDKLFVTEFKTGNTEKVSIINTRGQTVFEVANVSADGISVKLLPAGIYAAKFTLSNGSVVSRKILIQK